MMNKQIMKEYNLKLIDYQKPLNSEEYRKDKFMTMTKNYLD